MQSRGVSHQSQKYTHYTLAPNIIPNFQQKKLEVQELHFLLGRLGGDGDLKLWNWWCYNVMVVLQLCYSGGTVVLI